MTTEKTDNGKQTVPVTDKAQAAREARAAREAKALRANLLRRKQQQRIRPATPSTSSES